MTKNNSRDKKVYLGDQFVITDWRSAKIAPPENLQEKTKKQGDAGTRPEEGEQINVSGQFISVRSTNSGSSAAE
jgi:hypothetical protein